MMFERVNSLRADIAALEQSIERAGLALGCAYASQQEFENAVARAHRAQWPVNRSISQMQIVLGATTIASLLAIILLAV